MSNKIPIAEKDLRTMEKRYREGESYEEIAKDFPFSYVTVSRRLKERGVPSRGPGSKSNHINLSDNLVEFIEGLLLGDGCIVPGSPHKSARYSHGDSYEGYIKWLKGKLGEFGMEGKLNYMEDGDTWLYRSKCYVELLELREKWYPDGEKKIPEDMVITPTKLFNWYIGDGTPYEKRGFEIITSKLRGSLERIKDQLANRGIEVTIVSHGLYVPKDSRSSFLNYVFSSDLDIPSCYKYKFPKEVKK